MCTVSTPISAPFLSLLWKYVTIFEDKNSSVIKKIERSSGRMNSQFSRNIVHKSETKQCKEDLINVTILRPSVRKDSLVTTGKKIIYSHVLHVIIFHHLVRLLYFSCLIGFLALSYNWADILRQLDAARNMSPWSLRARCKAAGRFIEMLLAYISCYRRM
jgi:hypothetical protein